MTTLQKGSRVARHPHRIAIVGSGPRGMGVLERIAARVAGAAPGEYEIFLVDAVQVGCGRVWRTDQPDWFLMNTVCGEVTMFSGPPDDGPARPGAGPSLAQWWESVDPSCPGPDGYAPRALHGRYMNFTLETVEAALPPGTVHRVVAVAEDLEPVGEGYLLHLSDGRRLPVDRVVLTTGHPTPTLTGLQRELAEFAADRPNLRYIRGDSAADMPLDAIPRDAVVGILGIGLSFYDIMFALTVGRGGKFIENMDGGISYEPSGEEPLMVAGSRSGTPLPARGRNQKAATFSFRPKLFTPPTIRAHAQDGPLDFTRDVLPWLIAEIHLTYFSAILCRSGTGREEAFTADVVASAATGAPDVTAIAARHGLEAPEDAPDLWRLSRPFTGLTFSGPAEFERTLIEAMRLDLEHAERGNVDDPLKTSLDVLRDTRWVIRELVDFGGLNPGSHRTDFLADFAPRSSFLAAGPPRIRVRYALALIESGLLRVVGPDSRFAGDPATGRFVLSSPVVADSEVAADVVIDARIPDPHVRRDPSPLTRNLLRRGIWTEFVNGAGEDAFHTGGVRVTHSPFHPVTSEGRPETGIHVLGLPTEHTRWFTLVGSGRPGPWNEFIRDADAIAARVLSPAEGESR
ncbi:FAD/NAD(P)-binding protein [Streptosporangium algeriense]|uniref:FAD/NAD(P)-binding protein n=1 Tax=Streptosporangium algeriense TaxID=1682748 RepID=A0ABW3DPT9_9ACTN